MATSRDDIMDAIKALDAKVDEHIRDDRDGFTGLREILTGDAKDQIGLIPRMVRVEETARTQRAIGNWLLASIGTLLLGGVGTIAWALISMKAQGKLP
jgi:hypothetical protein